MHKTGEEGDTKRAEKHVHIGEEARKSRLSEKLRIEKKRRRKLRVIWITLEMAVDFDRETLLLSTLRDLCLFIIFAVAATIVATGGMNSSMYHLNRVLKDQLMAKNNFGDVRTAADVWNFLNETFTSSFYWDYWYYPDNEVMEASEHDSNLFYENKLIGVPRLRQLKVRNDSCPIHDYFTRIFATCHGAFSADNEDTDDFGLGSGTAWTYNNDTEEYARSFWGKIGWYHGGGFYQDLTLHKKETLEILMELKDNLWITRGTRIILLDFCVYNNNLNLFAVVTLAFEFPPTGGVITSSNIQVVKLLHTLYEFDYVILGCEYLMIGFIFFYIAEEVREICYFKSKYFLKYWPGVDWAIILIGISAIVTGFIKSLEVSSLISLVTDNEPEMFVDVGKHSIYQVIYTNLVAIQLFLIYLKIFKFLSFNRNLSQLNYTLQKCSKDMMGFVVMFLVIFVAFAILGHLIFGTEVEEFSGVFTAMFTLLRTILGDFNYDNIENANRILAPIYFLFFIFLVFFVLLNMFLAIINDTYGAVKTEAAIAPKELSMTELLKRGFYNLSIRCGCLKNMKRLKKVTENEKEIATNEIRSALRSVGFTNLEIEMFFSRYNIDPTADVGDFDIKKLMNMLEGKVDPTVPKDQPHIKRQQAPMVAIDDFIKQEQKLDEIEEALAKATNTLHALLERLDQLDYVQKVKTDDKK